MKGIWAALIFAGLLMAADPWEKVAALKSGSEVKVFKKGGAAPVTARLDEVTADNVVVVLKNEQVAIPKDEIERIDARPGTKGKPAVVTTTRTTPQSPELTHGPRSAAPGSSGSSSSSVTFGKNEFETVYRRSR